MRVEGFSWIVGSVAIAGAGAACTDISGLEPYSTAQVVEGGQPDRPRNTPETSVLQEPPEAGSSDATLEADPFLPITGAEHDAGPTGEVNEAAVSEGSPDGEASADDRGDDGSSKDASEAGSGQVGRDGGDGGCAVKHSNGIGQETFVDCAPLDTYNVTQATEACTAADAGSCTNHPNLCIAAGLGGAVCADTASPCLCWSYSGTNPGRVSTSKAGAVCACPAASDPFWH